MRVLLVSTYELGQQPLGIAVPAAALEQAGHETRAADLAIGALAEADLDWAEAVAVSIPMHTATRLAEEAVSAMRRRRPGLPVAWHGLYAPVLAGRAVVGPSDLLVAGETVPAILGWLEPLDVEVGGGGGTSDRAVASTPVPRARIELGPARSRGGVRPLRRDLPGFEHYARLVAGDRETFVASVATTAGCNHRCRHCPVASVYHGRSRPIEVDAVLGDVDAVVASGAGHVSFADPDFLNRPRHALEVVSRLHARHPALTFDATVKVEHLLRHRGLLPDLHDAGLLFVVSAFESVDDEVLVRLDKGHTALDEATALELVRAAGVELRPSWLPFTPWTTLSSFGDLLDFVARNDLVWSTDPVQYSIRLLLPRGSLLLDDPDDTLARSLTGEVDGSTQWRSPVPVLDELQAAFAARAEGAGEETPEVTFSAIWELARSAGVPLAPCPPEPVVAPFMPGPDRPRLTESWFCCAEPTGAQLQRLGSVS